MPIKRLSIAGSCALLVAAVSGAQGPGASADFVSAVEEQVLTVRQVGLPRYALRVSDDRFGDEQVLFALPLATPCQFELWATPIEAGSILDQVRSLLTTRPGASVSEAASAIVVHKTHHTVSCSGPVARLLREAKDLRPSMVSENRLFIDGTAYTLIVESASRRTETKVWGPRWPLAGHDSVHRWATALRTALVEAGVLKRSVPPIGANGGTPESAK